MSFGFGQSLATERKTGTLFGQPNAPPGGLFGQTQQSQQNATSQAAPSLFGTAPAQQQNTGGIFGQSQQQQNTLGNQGSTLFSASQQQQPQQQQQQPQQQSFSIFGGLAQPAPSLSGVQAQQLNQSQSSLPQLRQTANSQFASTLASGHREKSVTEQMQVIEKKWNEGDPECAFQYYFYNQVKPEEAPYYGPAPYEDGQKWEEALSRKPGPGAIPVLARGFEQIAARINQQALAVNSLQTRLHEINNALNVMKSDHELKFASRIAEARRKHIVFTQRTLALATKVQILRNRGYVMDQTEEELKKKLLELEKKTFDPVLGGRQEEIWARMSGVRERARILQEETEKLGKSVENQQNGQLLSEDDQKHLDKLLKDYDKQLEHLKKWVDDTKTEYDDWEKERKPAKSGR